MIVSASYRTDIPAFFSAWFRKRLAAGWCAIEDGGKAKRVDLTPTRVDAFVFWTKNAAPFVEALDDVERLGIPFVLHHTCTGYPRQVEPNVPQDFDAVAMMHEVAKHYGRERVIWRYDPVVITSKVATADWHADNFRRLASKIEGASDECVVSFVHPYPAVVKRTSSLRWTNPTLESKRDLLSQFSAIAWEHGMKLSTCAQPGLDVLGVSPAHCVDLARLSRVAGRPILASDGNLRPGCGCARTTDIGAYDTCPAGCLYCYATNPNDMVVHNPDAPMLGRQTQPREAEMSLFAPERLARGRSAGEGK